MQYIGSLEAAEKHISAKIFKGNLHTSVKILQICMDLQDSVLGAVSSGNLERFAHFSKFLLKNDIRITDVKVGARATLHNTKTPN